MQKHYYSFTRVSGNIKTGPIPVTMSSRSTCPDSCALKANGCYAGQGMVAIHWRRLDQQGLDLETLAAHIQTLPRGQLWRHDVAGDLTPSQADNARIDPQALQTLVNANKGRQGFTYTHHKVIGQDAAAKANRASIKASNEQGFTVNLSADDLSAADELASLGIGPVVTLLPESFSKPGAPTSTKTPAGRTVAVCPAVRRDDVQCANCGICANSTRKAIIGFPAHGSAKRKAEKVFMLRAETQRG